MNHYELSSSGIAYTVKGEGEPVVFLHGFCGSRHYFKSVAASLGPHYNAYYIDLPGHGDSKPMQYHTLEDYVEQLHKWKLELGLGKITLIGHSLGGYLTLAYAERYPEHVLGFGLIHSTAFPDSDEGKEGREKAIQTIQKEGIEPFVESLVPKLFDKEFAKTHPKIVKRALDIAYKTDAKQAIRFLRAMRDRKDRRRIVTETTFPQLLVAGETDEVVPSYKTFIGESKQATEKVIEDAAHMSIYEQPDKLSDIIKEWLNSLYVIQR